MTKFKWALLPALCYSLCQCASTSATSGLANMGGPTQSERAAAIASEPTGDFFYGRRYVVRKTRFWGYLRKPRQSADRAKLVIFKETRKLAPDRLPEGGTGGRGYAFDSNYEYKIRGNYTGEQAYDPNSNQFLPVFLLTGYELVDRDPGWLFRPTDFYNDYAITLAP